jgi:hypothetical protein
LLLARRTSNHKVSLTRVRTVAISYLSMSSALRGYAIDVGGSFQ